MPRDRVLKLIDRMGTSRIAVIGDLILDRYLLEYARRASGKPHEHAARHHVRGLGLAWPGEVS